ncbi:MAG TPA: hypothetical protein VJ765_04185 [Chitinophagaceae bacterium]|nr:hypothetical protein [Chitinophagaceae bacterium]
MKLWFLIIIFCACKIHSGAQLSLPGSVNGDQSIYTEPVDGKITATYTNGNKLYEGYLQKEKWHGQWNSWYDDGQKLDSGLMRLGIPDETWTGWYPDGTIQFIRTYSADKWQQFHLEKLRYHSKRISLPLTQLYHENKKLAEKYISAINSFCVTAKCTRVRNESLSQKINNNSTGDHYHPLFENGLLHGPFVNYFPAGAVKVSGNYKNGLPEGLWIKWTDDRQFYWKGFYQHGMKNKEWKLYRSSGQLVSIVFYKHGKYMWRKDLKEDAGATIGPPPPAL